MIVALSGCQYRLLVDQPKASEVKDIIRLRTPSSDFMNVVEKIGDEYNLETRKSAFSKGVLDPSMGQPLSVVVSLGGFGIGDAMMGLARYRRIEFSSNNNGKTWNCTIQVAGNSSYGEEDAALNFWSEFKFKLIQRLKNNMSDEVVLAEENSITPAINQPHEKAKEPAKVEAKSDIPTTKKSKRPTEFIYVDKNGNATYQ